MRKTKPLKHYKVVYKNGQSFLCSIGKMSRKELEQLFSSEAKADGTELDYFVETSLGVL